RGPRRRRDRLVRAWSRLDLHHPPAARHVRGSAAHATLRRRTMTHILVVEDEESYREPLAYLLRKEGYDVSVAASGTDALAAFERGGADLVLLDLMLPGMSGTEVCRELRRTSDV